MELEFDKEIDAILRRVRDGDTASAAVVSAHPDADVIAAFSENALPDKAKRFYIEHFSECGHCRKLLSQTILMNTDADAAAASFVSEPPIEAAIPWFQKIFRSPSLALSMGAMVLVFSGLLGYLVIQSGFENTVSEISQIRESESAPKAPASSAVSSNTAANNANDVDVSAPEFKSAANAVADSAIVLSNPEDAKSGATLGRSNSSTPGELQTSARNMVLDGVENVAEKPAVASPPSPPSPVVQPVRQAADRIEEKVLANKSKESDKDLALAKTEVLADDEGAKRDAESAPASGAGPTRDAQKKSQRSDDRQDSGLVGGTSTRKVGGKTFDNRGGVWYDISYNGQSTVNVRRGTDDYKKLDSGLRSIGNSLNGAVVVVWKEKAYRIQ